MLIEKQKIGQGNILAYFPYFNHSLFVDHEFTDDFDSKLSDESSKYISEEVQNNSLEEEKLIPLNLLDLSPIDNLKTEENKENENNNIKPELQKYIIPKEFFNNHKDNKKDTNKENIKDKINMNLDAKPYIPKRFQKYPQYTTDYSTNYNNSKKIGLNINKKDYIHRAGDWCCLNCKNLNFRFRKKCNKCGERKKVEKNCFEVFEELLTLAQKSYKNKML